MQSFALQRKKNSHCIKVTEKDSFSTTTKNASANLTSKPRRDGGKTGQERRRNQGQFLMQASSLFRSEAAGRQRMV